MNTPARLGIFCLALAAVFGAALGAGHLAGPVGAEQKPHTTRGGNHGETKSGMDHGAMGHSGHGTTGGVQPGGLLVSDSGYTFATAPDVMDAFGFWIIGPDRPLSGRRAGGVPTSCGR
jgi:hypothetical protein